MKKLLAAAVMALSASPVSALTVTGVAEATGPYTFRLEGYEVFLLGVESVERRQSCEINRQDWDCWAAAQRALDTILFEGPVTCNTVLGPDDRNQVLALCTSNGEDIGLRFVQSGFGLSIPTETTRYVAAEAEARAAMIGLWQGTFAPPRIVRSMPMQAPSTRPRVPAPIEDL